MVTVIFFGLGLILGSFANAAVWRIHLRQTSKKPSSLDVKQATSLTRGRSMCPDCRHPLAAADLIPVVSWALLRGKCRYCHKPISVQYPLVELTVAALFALSVNLLQADSNWLIAWVNLSFWLYFVVALTVLAVYDLRWYILPDIVLLPAIIVAMVQLGVWGALGVNLSVISGHVVAAVVAGGSFYLVAALSGGRWMGGGDIKLAFLMGLILGPSKTALAMFLAFNVAAVVGLLLIGFKLKSRRDHIPFGPFLVGATVIAQIYGQGLVRWYLHLAGIN